MQGRSSEFVGLVTIMQMKKIIGLANDPAQLCTHYLNVFNKLVFFGGLYSYSAAIRSKLNQPHFRQSSNHVVLCLNLSE